MIFLNKKWWCDDEILWDSPKKPQAAGTCGVSVSEGCEWMNLFFKSRSVFTCWMIILGSFGRGDVVDVGRKIFVLQQTRVRIWKIRKWFFQIVLSKNIRRKTFNFSAGNFNNYIPVMFCLIRNIVIAFRVL